MLQADAGKAVEGRGGILTGVRARLAGFLFDVLLLALFLVVGVALLDVLVKVIVLLVGYWRHIDFVGSGRAQYMQWEMLYRGESSPGARHAADWMALGLAVLAAVASLLVFFGGLRLRRVLLSKVIDVSFESYVSKRYLISREGGSLVNLITVVSVLGVSIGVMALVVVISVMNGFDRTIMERMMGVFAHAQIAPMMGQFGQEMSEAEYDRVAEAVLSLDGVVATAPVIYRQTFVQAGQGIEARKHGMVLYGFDVEREREVTRMTHNIRQGTGEPGNGEVVLGSQLYRKLGIDIGDRLYAAGKIVTTARGATPKMVPLQVVGVFSTGLHDVDDNFAYTNLATAQQLELTEGQVSYLHLRVRDPYKVADLERQLYRVLPTGAFGIRTWQDINPEFFHALQVEKVAMFVILLLIVLVASLNIAGTLVMVVTQKTREIGILKSMGARDGMILRIFLQHGLFIGIVGTTLGTACGLWLCRFVKNDIDKIFQLPSAVYGLDKLPVVVDWKVIALLATCSLVICAVAGLVPARRAARLSPVEALRYL